MDVLWSLAQPWLVVPWYAVGAIGAAWVVVDTATKNTPLDQPLKWAWPIIVLFFGPIGLALYWTTSRPPQIGAIQRDEDKERALEEYAESDLRKTVASSIHCVGGDGLGIVTAMIAARLLGMSFWEEFWLEYGVGFLFGWLIFQYAAMRKMADGAPKALAMAFRGELFSMMTVMAGMGAVMGVVTPLVVGEQPRPDTFAFWGFAMLGLLVGFVVTLPMNWMLVKVGWKHGLGGHG